MTIRAILLCIAACTIVEGTPTRQGNATSNENVCSSMDCLNAASDLSKIMDWTVDPCVDFHEFVCGNFLKTEPTNIDHSYDQDLSDKISEDLTELIEADIDPNEPKPFKLVKTLYKSCMDTSAIETKGVDPLDDYLRNLGGWPVVEGDSWNEQNFDWRRTTYKFRHSGNFYRYYMGDAVGHLIHFGVERNPTDVTEKIMSFKFPLGLLLPSPEATNFYQNPEVRRKYLESIVLIARVLGADNGRARHEINEVLSFEIKLTQMKLRILKLKKLDEHNLMSLAELNQNYPSVPWITYIKTFIPSSSRSVDEQTINVPSPDYYVELEALMAKTPKRVQANYVMSMIALRNALISTEAMRRTVYQILATWPDFPRVRDRFSYCMAEVVDHLPQGVMAMYANKFVDKEAGNAAKEIVKNLEWQLNLKLITYPWSDEATWNVVLQKMDGLVTHAGYPDRVLVRSKLEDLYGNLEFTKNDYFGNMDRLSNYDRELGTNGMEGPTPEEDDWLYAPSPISSRTRFLRWRNTIQIDGLHYRGRYFGKDRPKCMNYGALGSIIGHEMVHAIFENGIYRERCGKSAYHCGLTERPEFSSTAQCLIDHYTSYIVDEIGHRLDGRMTLTENLADVGGMRLAYDAYEGWAAVHPEEPKLPGFEQYSAKQMFWITAAAKRCEKITPATMLTRIRTAVHTIAKYRTIGVMSNIPEFAKDFNCKATTMMNPKRRCDIWQSP